MERTTTLRRAWVLNTAAVPAALAGGCTAPEPVAQFGAAFSAALGDSDDVLDTDATPAWDAGEDSFPTPGETTAELGPLLPTTVKLRTSPAGSAVAEAAPRPQTAVRVAGATSAASAEAATAESRKLPTVERNHYTRKGELGRGGLSQVVSAIDRRLRRPVAIKELLDENEESSRRFVTEAMLTARLQHPGIIPIYEAGRWPGGKLFYAMRKVAGRTLADAISARPTLPQRLALVPHVIAVADAVGYAHAQGIIHRDLKPDNVLLGEFGETVVIDWGIAKDLRARPLAAAAGTELALEGGSPSQQTNLGAILGTLAYMAPEQAAGQAVDARTDVFSLGALLYEVLSGEAPYAVSQLAETVARLRRAEFTPLAARVPDVPRELAAIVTKAMRRDPLDRYPTARELAADLRCFQTGQLVAAHVYSPGQLVRRWVKQRRPLLALAAVFTLLLLVIGVFAIHRIVRERNRAEERNHELILVQARAALERDPTQTLAWLKLYPATGKQWLEARSLALEAWTLGVAEHVIRKTEGKIAYAAFSPNGQYVAAAGPARTLQILDLGSGRMAAHQTANEFTSVRFGADSSTLFYSERDSSVLHLWQRLTDRTRVLTPGSAPIHQFALSADGRHVATAYSNGTLTVEAVATGKRLLTTTLRVRGITLRFSPTGQTLAYVGSDGAVYLFDLASGKTSRLPAHGGDIESLVYSAHGNALAISTSQGQAGIYTLASGRLLSLPRNDINNIAFAPSEQMAATVGEDRSVRLWDLATLRERSLGRHQERGIDVTYAPDGQSIASAGDEGGVRVWWPQHGDSRVLLGHRSSVYRVEHSADSQRLLSVSPDRTVRVWRLQPAPDHVLPAEGRVYKVDYLLGGRALVAIDDNGLWLWDRASDMRRRLLPGEQGLRSLAVSSDGRHVAVGSFSGVVHLLDLQRTDAGAQRMLQGHDNIVRTVAFSPDGAQLASAGADGTVRLWDVASGASRIFRGHHGVVRSLSFSPDGRFLASGGDDGAVRLWTTASGAVEVLRVHDKSVAQVMFSPAGTLLASAGADGTVRVWSIAPTATASLLPWVDRHSRAVRSLAFTPDGRTLATAGDSREVHLCDLPAGSCRVLSGHRDWIEKVLFSPDGRLVASASGDGTVRLWDGASGLPAMIYRHVGEVTDVAFAPDTQELASAGRDQSVRRAAVRMAAPPMQSGEALRPWLDRMTSAVIQDGEPTTP